jgi:hypothetical protein
MMRLVKRRRLEMGVIISDSSSISYKLFLGVVGKKQLGIEMCVVVE